MPWVRIDENAMDHPKIGGLPDGAFRLWVQGLAYCQKFLTDGLVNAVAVKGLRSYSPQRRAALVTAGLWDEADGGSVTVHDFLDWNDSRAEVIRAREDARERRRRSRLRHASSDADSTANVSSGVGGIGTDDLQKGEGGSGETDPVQRFVSRHTELYRQFCGVGYIGNPQKDYQAACQIVQTFPDPSMQDAILAYGLNDPDPFMAKDTRTIPKIACRASKYAEELKAKKLA